MWFLLTCKLLFAADLKNSLVGNPMDLFLDMNNGWLPLKWYMVEIYKENINFKLKKKKSTYTLVVTFYDYHIQIRVFILIDSKAKTTIGHNFKKI